MKRTSPKNILNRQVFETNRALEYLTEKELTAQIGHGTDLWPIAILRELIDNALDACEGAGVSPEIAVTVENDFITVTDNGPGIPEHVIERSLDYMVRVSDKAYYISPTRGQMGNALKVVYAAPYVHKGSGYVEIAANGKLHHIEIKLNQILQEPEILHTTEDHFIKNGTFVKIYYPDSSRLLDEIGMDFMNQWSGIPDDEGLVMRYKLLNPHVTFSYNGTTLKPWNKDWKKWQPNMPTSPHWYNEESLRDLISGYLAQEIKNGKQKKTVREFVSEFKGLSGVVKQKKVTQSYARAYLQDFVQDGTIDSVFISDLLSTMKSESKEVKPQALGTIGKEYITVWLEATGCVRDSVRYKKIQGISNEDDMPHVLEFATGIRSAGHRVLVTGLNWSPTIGGDITPTIQQVIQTSRIDAVDPVTLFIHLAMPRFKFMDRGKTRLEI